MQGYTAQVCGGKSTVIKSRHCCGVHSWPSAGGHALFRSSRTTEVGLLKFRGRRGRLQHVQPARAGPWEEEARRIEERARRMARSAESEAERAAARARSQTSQWASQDPDYVRERVTVWVSEQSNWSRLALPLLGTLGIAVLFGPLLVSLLFTGLAVGAFLTAGLASLTVISMIAPFALGFAGLWLFGTGFGIFATTGFFLLQPFIALAMLGSGFFVGTSILKAIMEGGSHRSRRRSNVLDIEAERVETEQERAARETEEMQRSAESDLRSFDELLKKRAREKDIDKGTYWDR